MQSSRLPDFDRALARFRAFLKQNNYSENVVRVMPEDILLTGKRFLYVRVPPWRAAGDMLGPRKTV